MADPDVVAKTVANFWKQRLANSPNAVDLLAEAGGIVQEMGK